MGAKDAKKLRLYTERGRFKIGYLIHLCVETHSKHVLTPEQVRAYFFKRNTRMPVHLSLFFSICDNAIRDTVTFFSVEEA